MVPTQLCFFKIESPEMEVGVVGVVEEEVEVGLEQDSSWWMDGSFRTCFGALLAYHWMDRRRHHQSLSPLSQPAKIWTSGYD